MSAPADRLQDAKRWTDRAEHDFAAAEYLLGMPGGGPGDVISFHAQQGAEKYLKALLVVHGVEVPRTHDLVHLLRLAGSVVRLALTPGDVSPLNRFLTEGRYPGDWEPVGEEDAREALALARKVREEVQVILKPAGPMGPADPEPGQTRR